MDVNMGTQNSPEGYIMDIEDTRELEERISRQEVSLDVLMSRAGVALMMEVKEVAPSPVPVTIFAGSGNNGGDGWVAARLLAQQGYPVALITRRAASDITAEPAHTAAMRAELAFMEAETPIHIFVSPEMERIEKFLTSSKVVVDAILGIGFDASELRAPYDSWINAINDAHTKGATVISADVPSGMSAETGDVTTPCVKADSTVCMLVYKKGLWTDQAKSYVGQLKLATLGIDISKYVD